MDTTEPEQTRADLIVMPWLRLREPLSFGGFQFRSISEQRSFDNEVERESFQRLVEVHREISGTRCREMTLVSARDNATLAVTEEFVQTNLEALEIAVDCLTMAGLATREFFCVGGMRYFNAASFEWFRYAYPIHPQRIHAWSRTRFGETFHLHDLQGFRRVAPIQCLCDPLSVDRALLQALERVTERAINGEVAAGKLLLAVRWFWHGNRDETFTDIRWEIGIMASALEQALDVQGAEALGGALQGRFEPVSQLVGQSQEITKEWAIDFYLCRHEPIHGNRIPNPRWERYVCHPTMASFVFPLALKCALAELGDYQLSTEDEGRIDAVPRLLSVQKPDRWRDEISCNLTRWQKIVQESVLARTVRRAAAEALAGVKVSGN